VPALRAPNDPRMTGAMPLIDERALAAEFELPEEDDGSAYAADEVADDDLVEVDDGVGLGRAGRAAADFAADFAMDDRSARAGSAAGEEHADEIAKILTETDVYVKYGLHQKAVDHLRKVFAIDPENVEARERLKDVLLAQGREREAIVELLRLAEVTAAFDSERAEGYLREVLGLDGGNRAAHELIDRFGFDLEVGAAPARAGSDFSLDPARARRRRRRAGRRRLRARARRLRADHPRADAGRLVRRHRSGAVRSRALGPADRPRRLAARPRRRGRQLRADRQPTAPGRSRPPRWRRWSRAAAATSAATSRWARRRRSARRRCPTPGRAIAPRRARCATRSTPSCPTISPTTSTSRWRPSCRAAR
jgi:tetratricopeptide (TPR) repeat protein